MAERPILFSSPMVQAIINGTKIMTRRISGPDWVNRRPADFTTDGLFCGENNSILAGFRGNVNPLEYAAVTKFPYGQVGDLLWVRESFSYCQPLGGESLRYLYADGQYSEKEVQDHYKISNYDRVRPSIHMPKVAARIWLKITDVRIERLQDISECDAIMEGIEELPPWPEAPENRRFKTYGGFTGVLGENSVFDPIFSFFTLWSHINGSDSVKLNPFVWVICFARVASPDN